MSDTIQSIQWFPGHMAKTKRKIKEILPIIDAVAEVVDARIPISSRNPDLNDIIERNKIQREDILESIINMISSSVGSLTNPKKLYDFELEKTIDETVFLPKLIKVLEGGERSRIQVSVTNMDRTLGTLLGSEITRRFEDTLEEDRFEI